MGLWDIILPQQTGNVITNPSFELGTTGWTAVTGTLSRSTAQQRFGLYSLTWVPSTSTTSQMYYSITLGDTITYTYSVYLLVNGGAGQSFRLYFGNTSGTVLGSAVTFTATGAWQRVQVTYNNSAPGSARLYLAKNGGALQPTIYIDGAQCEAWDPAVWTGSTVATTYCDGDQSGCTWASQAHASTSGRAIGSTAGGLVVNLDALNVYVKDMPGTGMPQVDNVATSLAMHDGAVYQRTLAKPRVFTLQLTAYNPTGTGSLAGLHSIRKALINAIKPDRVGQQQPFILQYSGGGNTIRLAAFYDAGLEWGTRNGFTEEIALRCIAYDPYWTSEYDTGSTALATTSLAGAAYLLRHNTSNGWFALGTGLNATPRRAYQSPDGTVYVAGSFTTAGGSTVNYVAKWNNSSWSAMGTTGLAGGTPTAWGLCSDGTASGVYVFGQFTTAGGVTCNNIARWNGSAWSALGSTPGTNAIVYDAELHPNGLLYVVGNFTTAGGVTVARFASYNPVANTWAALGAGVTGGAAQAITLGADGKLYLSGLFTSPGNYNVAYDPATGTYTVLGTAGPQGTSGISDTLIDGTIVNGSSFSDPITSTSVAAAQWNGAAWARLEPYTPASVNTIRMIRSDPNNRAAYIAGSMGDLVGIGPTNFAYWNGSAYLPLDLYVPAANGYMLQPLMDGTLIAGFDASVTAITSGTTTITNSGTAAAQPRISVTGPGQLFSIINQTTGDALYFDSLTLQTGETLVIDLRTGVKSFLSNYRNCLSYVSPVSNIVTFRLLPGANTIAIFVANASATASIVWSERYWSIDGGAP